MPFGDGTGPQGLGPMTGRGAGYCAGFPYPGCMNPYFGRGYFGWGRGWFGPGRGWRNWARITGLPGWWRAQVGLPAFGRRWSFWPSVPEISADQEKELLSEELENLKEEMRAIKQRLRDLDKISQSKKIKVEQED